MRLSVLQLSISLIPFALLAHAEEPPVLTCSVPVGSSSADTVQLDLDKLGELTPADLLNSRNWTLSTVIARYSLARDSVTTTPDASGIYLIVLRPDRLVDYTGGPARVRFRSANGNLEATCKPSKIEAHSHVPVLTDDPKDADITISGSLQAAVGDTPQYSYSVDGKYDVFSTDAHAIAATFKAVASQQHNADPDSMKLAANYRWLCNLPNQYGLIISSDLIAYEFERAVKKDKPVALDQPAPEFIEKNSNRIHSAQVTFIRSTPVGSFFFRPLGIEGGQSITRTVKKDSRGVAESSILRGVFGADYFMFFKNRLGFHRIDFEAHHTQRVLHFSAPYKRASLNDGKQYLSRYARPVSTAKLTFTLREGFGFSFAYLRGSLPPSFEFVDHQLTIGLTILLKRK